MTAKPRPKQEPPGPQPIGRIALKIAHAAAPAATNPTIKLTTWPEGQSSIPGVQLIRCPPKGLRGAIVISHMPITVPTHWWGGRTTPCVSSDDKPCPACEKQTRVDFKSYMFIVPADVGRPLLLELPPPATIAFRAWFKINRTLRGCRFSLARRGNRPKGQVLAETLDKTAVLTPLPDAPSLMETLCRIWRVTDRVGGQLRDNSGAELDGHQREG